MRPGGGAAILVGAAVGIGAAWLRQASPPKETTAPARAPERAQAPSTNVAPNVAPPIAPTAVRASATAPSGTPALTVTTAAQSAAEPTGAPSAAASAPVPTILPAFPIQPPRPPVSTALELERAEVLCYGASPEECSRAAAAHDAGLIVPRNKQRAEQLRKVGVTRLVRYCEDRSPHACLVLAERHELGDGVPQNDKRARALLAHARELCTRRPQQPECVNGEPR